ncbi:MAG: YkgJ family cysteine cluster protein [Deltaproteobacteria bacterium]|nr:YkgJ family cysteine cluster protein [Deltaproteobacteria bacterium]
MPAACYRSPTPVPPFALDCQRCGACCTNPAENRNEGFRDWVEIDPRDVILQRPKQRHLIVLNNEGQPHLRLDPAGRCVALRGKLGQRVTCAIYEIRPRACQRLQAGSDRCLEYRRERGFET